LKKIFFMVLAISLWASGEVLSQSQTDYNPFRPPFGLPPIAPIPPVNTNTRSDSGQDPLELRVPLQPSGESLLGIGSGSQRSDVDLNKLTERRAIEEEAIEEATITPEEEITEAAEEEKAETAPSIPVNRRVYRWVDKNGVAHFTNNLGSVPSDYVNEMFEGGR